MTRTMYDSVNAQRIPADATMVACYIDGRYKNEAEMRQRFPHATIVRITPHGVAGAHVADCETGDLTPSQAAAWAKAEVLAGRQPTIYCSLGIWDQVRAAVAAAGVEHHVWYWIAHYSSDSSIPAGAIAVQWKNDVGANIDVSTVADYWPGVDPLPVVHPESQVPPQTGLKANPYLPYAATCSKGSEGKQVLFVSWALDHAHQRDTFDTALAETVKSWQLKQPSLKAEASGTVGPNTLALLKRVLHH